MDDPGPPARTGPPASSWPTRHRVFVPVEQTLRAAGGCLLRRDLVRSRAEGRELADLVAAVTILRLGRGAYALPTAPPDVVAPRLVDGLLTCVSAAARLGLPLLDQPVAPHVAIHSSRRSPRGDLLPAGTQMHWDGRILRSPPRSGHGRLGAAGLMVAPELALVHALRCLPPREVVALWDAAVNRSCVRLADLAALRPARAGRRAFDAVLRATDGRSQSMPETFLRLGLRRAGLRVEPQALVEGIGFVDLLVERRVVVEVDGYAFHSDRVAFGEDRRRDRAAVAVGLISLRFGFGDAVRTTGAVMEIDEAVRRSRIEGRPCLDDRLVAVGCAPAGR